MRRAIAFLVLVVLVSRMDLCAQDPVFGKKGFHFNVGFSIIGPEVSIGNAFEQGYGEWYYVYHLIDYETNENLWNKPTSGGWKLGVNYFPWYGGTYSSSRWKWFIGLGANNQKERLGENAYTQPGDVTEGEWKFWDVHLGTRFFAAERLSMTLWIGYAFSIDDSDSMLKKQPHPGVTEEMAPVDGNLTILLSL